MANPFHTGEDTSEETLAQSLESAPQRTTAQSPHSAQILAIVLPPLSPDREVERFGVIPYSPSYATVLQHIAAIFGSYRPFLNPDNSVLRYRIKNLKGELVWADVQPEHWSQLVPPGAEVAIFPSESPFLIGSLFLTYGKEVGGETLWTHSRQGSDVEIWVNRPRSYQEANVLVQNAIGSLRYPSSDLASLRSKNNNKFKYCYFEKARHGEAKSQWKEFPPEAYVHDRLWQEIVPPPGTFLGIKLDNSNPPSYHDASLG